jgi:hypothetical protein
MGDATLLERRYVRPGLPAARNTNARNTNTTTPRIRLPHTPSWPHLRDVGRTTVQPM